MPVIWVTLTKGVDVRDLQFSLAKCPVGLRRSGAGVNADDLFDSKPSPRTDSIVRRCGSVGGACHCICPFDHGTPNMTVDDFHQSLTASEPPAGLTLALAGLWWDAKRDWTQAHASAQQDELFRVLERPHQR